NALQRVPFTINVPVLDFMLRSPPPRLGPKPPAWQREEFEEWQKTRSRSLSWHMDMLTAEAMACLDRFWVPLNIDFRGRVYGIPHFNFAREDHVRGLFLFADGEEIGADGLPWLKAHVAATANKNTWSRVEKPGELPFDGRVAWTDGNLETVRRVGEAVLHGDDPAKWAWAMPKDRCQFLAACVELVQALAEGPSFKTRLPLTFDATCSGLQHFCLMTRAEEARYVNLIPADEQDDFFRRVGFRAFQAAPDLGLMESPFDREIVKQPAMSYFYGSRPGGFAKKKGGKWRPHGMTRQIIDVLKERRKNDKERRRINIRGAKE